MKIRWKRVALAAVAGIAAFGVYLYVGVERMGRRLETMDFSGLSAEGNRFVRTQLPYVLGLVRVAEAQQKKTDCKKPPEIVPPPKQSKEEKQKQSKAKVQGAVAIEISEDGEVVSAKAQPPSKGESADQLESFAKSMKFKPRPGCGSFKTVVNGNVGSP
jgi:hypothetical protein